MVKPSVQKLASQLKVFLEAQEEDEFIIAATPNNVAASSSIQVKPINTPDCPSTQEKMKEGSVLTVEFAKENKKNPTNTMAKKKIEISTTSTILSTQEKQNALNELAAQIQACTKCPLGGTRLNAVPGEGNVDADVMFVGEGPGFDEDRQGRPFVGRAGQLLDKMIVAMGLSREKVFIANVVKCHPMTDPLHPDKHGNDRAPIAGEIAGCRKYLEKQIAIVCPKYVVALGGVSAKALISDAPSLAALRGKFHDLHLDSVSLPRPVKIIATFHPAALLRNPSWKKDAWIDLQMVMDELGLKGARK